MLVSVGEQPSFVANKMLRLLNHVNSIFNSVSYVILDDDNLQCWIIDVGDYEDLKEIMAGYELAGVLLTHVHYDHIYGINKLLTDYPNVPIFTNKNGAKSLVSPSDNLSTYHGDKFVIQRPDNIKVVSDCERYEIGTLNVKIIKTPGHDYTCLSYIVGQWLFSGDAYIPGEKVFFKLQNGNNEEAVNSRSLLKVLSNKYILCPGHKR